MQVLIAYGKFRQISLFSVILQHEDTTMPHQLIHLAEENGIAIEYFNTETDIEAVYMALPECPPVIWLPKNVKTRYHLRSLLAHELGHHFTTGKSTTGKVFLHYRDRVEANREEARAWRWAANYLIPDATLKEVLSENFCEIWQLADFFEVDEEVVKIRFKNL